MDMDGARTLQLASKLCKYVLRIRTVALLVAGCSLCLLSQGKLNFPACNDGKLYVQLTRQSEQLKTPVAAAVAVAVQRSNLSYSCIFSTCGAKRSSNHGSYSYSCIFNRVL